MDEEFIQCNCGEIPSEKKTNPPHFITITSIVSKAINAI